MSLDIMCITFGKIKCCVKYAVITFIMYSNLIRPNLITIFIAVWLSTYMLDLNIKYEVLNFIKNNIFIVIILTGVVSSLITYLFATTVLNSGVRQKEGVVVSDISPDESTEISHEIMVDLAGAISNPGLYKISTDSRVGDLVKMGGGFSNDASARWIARNFNLSDKLNDAQKIYVPFEWDLYDSDNDLKLEELLFDTSSSSNESVTTGVVNSNENTTPSVATTVEPPTTSINVNTATIESLDTLPGIGPAYAQKIIDNRPYKDVSEFSTKSTLSQSLIDKIKALIVF